MMVNTDRLAQPVRNLPRITGSEIEVHVAGARDACCWQDERPHGQVSQATT
jgi:hypothetical protein